MSSFEEFQAELSATIAAQRIGRDAIWTDGTVTVRARGISRVNQTLPQPTAEITVETAFEERHLRDVDWGELWATVDDLRTDAQQQQTRRRMQLTSTASHHRRAEAAARTALQARDAVIRDALDCGIPATEVAKIAQLSEPAVYKIARQR